MDNIILFVEKILNFIADSPIVSFGGILLSIIGFISAYVYRRKSLKFKDIEIQIVSTNLIEEYEERFPKLSILYENNNLSTITVSRFFLRNSGNDVILESDIAPLDPILLSFQQDDGNELLDWAHVYSKDPANNIQIEPVGENQLCIKFDFLEPKDYAIIQLLHTGKDSSVIKISGTIIGAKEKLSEKKNLDERRQLASRSPFGLNSRAPQSVR